MLKKVLIVGGGVALLTALVFGRSTYSYVSTAVCKVRDTVKDNVPLEFEIERARKMIKDLEPEIRGDQRKIVKEEVAVEKLASQLQAKQDILAENKEDILRLRDDLNSSRSTYVYAGETYADHEVREELAERFKLFEGRQSEANNLAQALKVREKGLTALRNKVSEKVNAQRQLEVEIANLEARRSVQEVEMASSNINIDNSQLARTRDLIEEINTRLDIQDRMLDADTRSEGIQLRDTKSDDNRDIVDEVTRFFDEQPAAGTVAGN